MDLKKRAEQLKRDIPAVFLAMKSPETPFFAKAMGALAVVYAISPIDLIPDFIPVVGYLDDLLILPALVALAVRLIPAEVLGRCREQAEGLWKEGGPKAWYCALPIVALWLLAAFLIVKAIWL